MRLTFFEQPPQVHTYANPDWEEYLIKEQAKAKEKRTTMPLKVGVHVASDIGFPSSGNLITLSDGSKVWRTNIVIEGAPAIGLLLDQFRLPKGVKLFLTNENRLQVVGAFDQTNNSNSGEFAIDAIQGGSIFLEMNIEPGVDLQSI